MDLFPKTQRGERSFAYSLAGLHCSVCVVHDTGRIRELSLSLDDHGTVHFQVLDIPDGSRVDSRLVKIDFMFKQ